MVNALRWLSDRAVEAGGLLDLSATVPVHTPGHPDSRHLPGWDPVVPGRSRLPVHMGPGRKGRRHRPVLNPAEVDGAAGELGADKVAAVEDDAGEVQVKVAPVLGALR